jgi:hypothetical protein
MKIAIKSTKQDKTKSYKNKINMSISVGKAAGA